MLICFLRNFGTATKATRPMTIAAEATIVPKGTSGITGLGPVHTEVDSDTVSK